MTLTICHRSFDILNNTILKVLSSINTIYDDLEAERSKIMDALSLQVGRISILREDNCKNWICCWKILVQIQGHLLHLGAATALRDYFV